jgi:hypothetical protein
MEAGVSASDVDAAMRPAISPRISPSALLADINAVRARFGLPKGEATTAFQNQVVSAARQLRDPDLKIVPPGTVFEDGIWGAITTNGSAAALDPQDIVNLWVYQDGWRGTKTPNMDCTSPSAPGCNGHRRAVLRSAPTPGARLLIDVYAVDERVDAGNALSIAAVLTWAK